MEKILFVSHDDGKYGAALCLKEILQYFAKNKNVKVTVLTRKYNEINIFCNNNNIQNFVLPYVSCVTIYQNNPFIQFIYKLTQHLKCIIFNYISYRLIIKKIDINSFDYIYTNVSIINFGYYLARKSNIKHCWHLREFGLEDMNAVPVSNSLIQSMNQSNKLIAISNAIKGAWVKKGVIESKISVIYDGVEDNIVYLSRDNTYFANMEYYTLIFMGSSSPHKGLEQLIDAISICINKYQAKIYLDIYGSYDNEYGLYIIEKVSQLNLTSYIQFKGFINNIFDKICYYDLGVVCSKSEGFGRVTVEYMMAGVPVIASDRGANTELIKNNYNGILYEFNNSNDLAKKILYTLKNYDFRVKVSKRAYEYALKNFSYKINAEAIYNYLSD